MINAQTDNLDPGRRFILGKTLSSRLEVDFFNLYAWLLQMVEDKTVLDMACGSGLGSFLLAHKARRVVGVDVSPDAIAFARSSYNRDNVEFIADDLVTRKDAAGVYDIIVFSMTLEQIDPQHHRSIMRSLRTALAPDGAMVLVTPNKRVTSPYSKAGHGWNAKEYYKSELLSLFAETGWQPVAWYGRRRVFTPLTWYMLRKCIGLVQRITRKNMGLYGRRESPAVLPVGRLWQPKDFVIHLKPITM